MTDNLEDKLHAIICCPACLGSIAVMQHRDDKDSQQSKSAYQCSSCKRIYPIRSHAVVDFRVVDYMASLPEQYLGPWLLSQHRSIHEYASLSEGSVSLASRPDVASFSNYIKLHKKTVLDIGSGTGYLPGYIEGHDVDLYIGLDPIFPTDLPGQITFQGIGEMMPFKENSFDIILLATSLDHVICPSSLFSEIVRVLRPGGEVFIWSSWYYKIESLETLPARQIFSREDVKPVAINELEGEKLRWMLDIPQEHAERLEALYSSYMVDQYHVRHVSTDLFMRLSEVNKLQLTNLHIYGLRQEYYYAFAKLNKASLSNRKEDQFPIVSDLNYMITKALIEYLGQEMYTIDQRLLTLNKGLSVLESIEADRAPWLDNVRKWWPFGRKKA